MRGVTLAATLLSALGPAACVVKVPDHCGNLAGDATCRAQYGDAFQCSSCDLSQGGCVEEGVDEACAPPSGVADHCANQANPDQFCAALTDGVAPVCSVCASRDVLQGCVAEEVPTECAASPSDPDTGTGSGSGSEGTDTSETGTTGDLPECDEPDGAVSPACEALDPSTPFCTEAGTCAACDGTLSPDDACLVADINAPLCDAGVCVQCISDADCGGDAPICEASVCRGCVTHTECPVSACRLESGACFDPSVVRWVDGDKPLTECVGADGTTEATAVCNLAQARATLAESGVLKVKPTADPINAPYPDTIQIGGGEEFAVLGTGATRPRFVPPDGPFPTLDVTGGVVYLDFVELAENNIASAIACDANGGTAAVYGERTVFALSGRYAFEGTNCRLVLRDASLHDNTLGGLRMVGGNLDAINTSMSYNGAFGPIETTGAVYLEDAEVDRFSYNTLAFNQGSDVGVSHSLSCAGTVTGSVRNSILLGRLTESVTAACASDLNISTSVVDTTALLGGSNEDGSNYDLGVFLDLAAGDLHLTASVPVSWTLVAAPQAGDPALDIDQEPRGMPTGAPGVDEPN